MRRWPWVVSGNGAGNGAYVELVGGRRPSSASRDGTSWAKRKGTDNHTMQQAEARVAGLGYVQVAGVPAPVPSSPAGTGGGSHTAKTILLVAAICLLLVGAGLVLRSRG